MNQKIGQSSFGLQQSLAKLTKELGKNRRRIIGMPQAKSTPYVDYYPFKVYFPDPNNANVLESSGFAYGTIFDSSGNPNAIRIDSTQPTNLPVTVNPNTDGWRFVNVRGGYFYYRGQYTVISPVFGFLSEPQYQIYPDPGGIDGPMNGTDWVAPCYPGLEQSWDTQTGVSQSNYIPIGVIKNGCPVIIDGAWDGQSDLNYLIWLDIPPDNPDTGFQLIQIKAVRANTVADFPYVAFPYSIPIAYINKPLGSPSYNLLINQIQFGHVALQYGVGLFDSQNIAAPVNGDTVCGPCVYRGNWSTDPIKSMAFYPGDFVVVNQSINFGGSVGIKTNRQMWMQTIVGFTSDPATDPDWIQIGGL